MLLLFLIMNIPIRQNVLDALKHLFIMFIISFIFLW